MGKESVEAANGLLQKAIDFLFKGLDKLIEESLQESKAKVKVKDTQPIKKEGKVGKTYKFAIDDLEDGGVYVDVWPIEGKKNIFYVDRIEPYGYDDSGNRIKFDKEFKPKTFTDDKLLEEILLKLDDAGIITTKKGLNKEESKKRAKSAVRDWEKKDAKSKESESDLVNDMLNPENPVASTKFRAKLRKVTASNTFDLMEIDYDKGEPDKIWDTLCDIVENDEFSGSVESEEPVFIEVTDDGDDIDVESIDEFKVDLESASKFLYDFIVDARNNLWTLSSACRDTQFLSFYDRLAWSIDDMVRCATGLRIKYGNVYPNPGCVTCTGSDIENALRGYEGISKLYEILREVVDVVSLKCMSFSELDRAALISSCEGVDQILTLEINPYLDSIEN